MNRRRLRDYTFKLLFHATFYRGGELEEQVDNYLEECMCPEEGQPVLTQEDRKLLKERFERIREKLPVINEHIAASSSGWRPERMNRVDLTVIRLACYEIAFDRETPESVAINEAVELARKYGGDESPQFVNGILGKMVREGFRAQTEE